MNRSERRRMKRRTRAAAGQGPTRVPAAPTEALHQAIALHQSGRAGEAEALLERLNRDFPGHPAVSQLLGLARLERGAVKDAVTLFRHSLKADPRQPHVHNNLGNALLRLNEVQAAEASYRKALQLNPNYAEAQYNLGAALATQGRHEQAVDNFRLALKLSASDPRILNAMGDALRELGRFAEALDALKGALQLRPDYAEAHHNLGLTLAGMADFPAALEAYDAAVRHGLDSFQLHHNRANAAAELGHMAEAVTGYREAIARRPDYADSHRNLNNLLWEQGQTDDYLRSYEHVLDRHPETIHLYASYAAELMRQHRIADAVRVIDRGLKVAPDFPETIYVQAQIQESQGHRDAARDTFERCIRLAPDHVDYRVGLGRLLLSAGEPRDALRHLDGAVKRAPFHQLALAYQSLAWRILGDPRDDWLNDYENFVRPYELPVPAGHPDLQSFLAELAQTLDQLHTATNNPTYQTLRHGTQTAGALFRRREPVITALQTSLRQCIADYARQLPDDPAHPLVARRSAEFEFAGSWSVRLRRSGFHTIHVHPKGWLSSAFYVRVPEVVGRDDEKAGWIKFGQPDMDVGEAGAARRFVQPQEGRLVLFPSYMWHGTVPFETDEVRMTVAFDVAPTPDPAARRPAS